ncbi:hypothetical protein ACQR1W_21275 [Bradyrhizobium sp. HKCCYLS1011]|uniref:hypothetical protein n=1 Tax=Bradyrhizobium sp. HKCCYLS1011 TaxID=3420733 RepID=UPI003EC041BE
MKLVWHADNLLEVDWLRDVLGDLVEEECTDLALTCFDDDCIHVVSSNSRPLPAYEDYFQECRARCRRLVLLHTSDEWFSGGYALYRHFDAVIRNFATGLARHEGIWTIPEGYANGTRTSGAVRPITERPYVWSFTGEIKASRTDMAAAFAGLEPNFLTGTASIYGSGGRKLSKPEFDDVLDNTMFSPCPMGNAILETWRLYESLELGCIPIIETRASIDYFTRLFGPHPIPSFRSWEAARTYAQHALADKSSLLRKQSEISSWWTAKKQDVRKQVRRAATGPSHRAALQRFGALTRNRYPPVHEPLRLLELLRHQSGGSLMRRIKRPGGPLRRIARESLRNLRA